MRSDQSARAARAGGPDQVVVFARGEERREAVDHARHVDVGFLPRRGAARCGGVRRRVSIVYARGSSLNVRREVVVMAAGVAKKIS